MILCLLRTEIWNCCLKQDPDKDKYCETHSAIDNVISAIGADLLNSEIIGSVDGNHKEDLNILLQNGCRPLMFPL